MKWRRFRRRLKNYLLERLTFSLIPHARTAMRSIRMPRIVFIFLIICILGYVGTVTYLFGSTFQRYEQAKETIVSLHRVETENKTLRLGLNQVAKETEQMRKILTELEQKGQDIEAMLSDEENLSYSSNDRTQDLVLVNYTLLEKQRTPPLGGGDGLLDISAFELMSQIREELRMLRIDLPLQEESIENLELNVEDYKALQLAMPQGWPLEDQGDGYISSNFGFRKDPLDNTSAFHEGLDIGVWYGTPILATADGKVTYADWMGNYGRIVIIDHGYGYETRFAHNSKLAVQVGDIVKRGDVVAYSGNSGKSTGPHLHYEVRVHGVPKDPRNYIKN